MLKQFKVGELIIFKPSVRKRNRNESSISSLPIECGGHTVWVNKETPPLLFLGTKLLAPWGKQGKKYKYHHFLHDGRVYNMKAFSKTAQLAHWFESTELSHDN